MYNFLNSIKTAFLNVGLASDTYELKNLKCENSAARVLPPGAPRAQHSDPHQSPGRSLFSMAFQSLNAIIVSARASRIGKAMAKGTTGFESALSTVNSGKSHSAPVKNSSTSRASSPSLESAALAKVCNAVKRNQPEETIKALKNMQALVGSDEQKLNQIVMARLNMVGKTQVNAFRMVNQFLSNDPWKGEQQHHDNADAQVRQFYANLCRSFEVSWTAMPR